MLASYTQTLAVKYVRDQHSSLFCFSIGDKEKKFHNTDISGLYYKHMTIIIYTSSIINKLEALLTDDARVVIYNRLVFIVQATGQTFSLSPMS